MKRRFSRKSKKLTLREATFLEYIRNGKTITKAALAAGYSRKWPGQAGSQAFRNIYRKRPRIYFELGRTVEAIMSELRAKKI
jgi:phage terminase small subunit